ncbi:ATP-dependent nuclease [Evansella cellulosilytica]|uniref:ATP-dependent endonuclease of the OLD family n=1 Tax=Evansella cellulosilytica (strain ATCC 21833 / DSM 2522 / FERM P-1141 / JCM 9156 / N-4) TaxID=649639 RepID=E6TYV7_EVAC2|nr:AAA family ATPase [Evansella cellulosilytica]ADU31292.1 ATP-dependent endonuclease of the OLD family [Evansella cellulosilytica DSM 2522]
MNELSAPYISRVKIKNFRNYKDVDVVLSHKQVIIGENNVGKTNFLRAIQIILDPKLSDEDRYLNESDFFDGLVDPMKNGDEIEIIIEIKGFEHNKSLLSMLADATIRASEPVIRLTYHYFPVTNINGKYEYEYTIFQGEKTEVAFNHSHRKYLNLKVINAIRDVEAELKNIRRSPINQLLKQYKIDKDELVEISNKLKQQSNDILTIDELVDLQTQINKRFSNVLGNQPYSKIALETVDVDPNRILNTLKLMIGIEKQRPTSETSLGLNNILYISLILLSLEDKTIPSLIKKDTYDELILENESDILTLCYEKTEKENYSLKQDLNEQNLIDLYSFMDTNHSSTEGFTIPAIEEPEAHLHPTFQRIIYKDVMKKNTSVLMTTHSPYITSVAPLDSIVHLRATNQGTVVHSTATIELTDGERRDLERYIDVKKGEIYFGKGVILVEGIAEEYLIPAFADLLEKPLDLKGIICCNINSTNFKPFVKFLDLLGIPYVALTDGDFYIEVKDDDDNEPTRKFHIMSEGSNQQYGYLGNERISSLLIDLQKLNESKIPDSFQEQDKFFSKLGFFIGRYTMEVDIMDTCSASEDGKKVIFDIFNELTSGGSRQQTNFRKEFEERKYWDCLKKIESSNNGIGKGRFSQRLSTSCRVEHIPSYIDDAITDIYARVDEV